MLKRLLPLSLEAVLRNELGWLKRDGDLSVEACETVLEAKLGRDFMLGVMPTCFGVSWEGLYGISCCRTLSGESYRVILSPFSSRCTLI